MASMSMTDEVFATSLFLTRLRQTHENTLPKGIPKVTCKQLYEEEVLELAPKEGARPEAEGKDRRKGLSLAAKQGVPMHKHATTTRPPLPGKKGKA